MEEFRGEPEQYRRLHAALRQLYDRAIKSTEIEKLAMQEAKSLGQKDWMTRSDLDKFRNGHVGKPRTFYRAVPVWNVVFSPRYGLPTAERDAPAIKAQEANGAHAFFHSCVTFYDVHQHRQVRARQNLVGRFKFYHFSELFHKSESIPRAVVVGQWDIDFTDGAFTVHEKQYYDGRLGKEERHDVYTGYCLPKGLNICFLMREAHKETPKFYMLAADYDDPVTFETKVFKGHMLKGSPFREYFHSPVYAVRVAADQDVACNILCCDDVPPHVMDELEVLSRK